MKSFTLGAATAWSRDRFEPAHDLLTLGNVKYLCFDAMSEVTMSAAQVARLENPGSPGYDPYLARRMAPILRECKERGTKIITNSGWLDPVGAARLIVSLAEDLGLKDLKVAAVGGGILTDRIADMGLRFTETGEPISDYRQRIVAAEAYLGAEGIAEGLRQGADVVVTTRVADACLFLGPMMYEFNWDWNDHDRLAAGMILGHLVECGAQVCGGYFADPGYKDVPRLAELGNPILEVREDLRAYITKVPGSGGVVSAATCKEQLLYEVQDPSAYLCPDVVADLTRVKFREVGKDKVEVLIDGAGKPKTDTLKALVGIKEGFMTEEMVLFAGPGAMERAKLTEDILRARFRKVALDAEEIRMDYVGLNAVHRESSPAPESPPYEVVLRVTVKTRAREEAEKLRVEIDPLAVNGAYGTGKWATSAPGSKVRPVIGLYSTLVPRSAIDVSVLLLSTSSTMLKGASARKAAELAAHP
jgi:acyclic terpene utilization AtuA family protein